MSFDLEDYLATFKNNNAYVIEKSCYLKSWSLKLTWEGANLALGSVTSQCRLNGSLYKNVLFNDFNTSSNTLIEGFFKYCNPSVYPYINQELNTLMGSGGEAGFIIPTNAQRAANYYEELTHTFTTPIFLHKGEWLNVKLHRNAPYALISGADDSITPKVTFNFDVA